MEVIGREKLRKLVFAGFCLLVLAFLLVLFTSLGGRPSAPRYEDIALGESGKRRLGGQPVWITRLNPDQQQALGSDNPCAGREICVIAAAGTRAGIDLSYSHEKPPQLTGGEPWSGGFVDPASGAVFDLAGRALSPVGAKSKAVIIP